MQSPLFIPYPFSLPHRPPFHTRTPPHSSFSTRALGVDYGLRRIGLAVSIGISPRLLRPLHHSNDPTAAASSISDIATSNLCDTIVIGHPLDVHGVRGEQAEATDRFVDEVRKAAEWASVWLVDERFTSMEAKEKLREWGIAGREVGGVKDCVAAAFILQRFFEEKAGKLVQKGTKGGGVTKIEGVNWGGGGYKKWKQEIMKRVREEGS